MPRVSYVNGRFIRHRAAGVHVEDRGFQFADAVYEVIAVADRRMVDEDLHFDRLERSLNEIRMELPFSRRHFAIKIDELLRLNRVRDGSLYLQVSRGVAARDHKLPGDSKTSVVMTVGPIKTPAPGLVEDGVEVITLPDLRWKRPDIKSVALLPNVLARDEAVRAGAYEAWQYNERREITEGTSTNAWIVEDGDTLITHPADEAILNGVTRMALLRLANACGATVHQRPFTVDEAQGAREAFLSSTSSFLIPVVRIDGEAVGDGRPGPLTRKLQASYDTHFWQPAVNGAASNG